MAHQSEVGVGRLQAHGQTAASVGQELQRGVLLAVAGQLIEQAHRSRSQPPVDLHREWAHAVGVAAAMSAYLLSLRCSRLVAHEQRSDQAAGLASAATRRSDAPTVTSMYSF